MYAIRSYYAVATGRIIIENGKYKIGRIAVLKEERGKQYGDFIVKMLVNKGFLSGAEEVYVGALKHAISFYKKIGFEECGEPYTDMGMLHYPMKISQGGVCVITSYSIHYTKLYELQIRI